MRCLCHINDNRVSGDCLSQDHRNLVVLGLQGRHHDIKADCVTLLVRDLDSDCRLAGDRGQDSDILDGKLHGDVLRVCQDRRDLDSLCQAQLVKGERRSVLNAYDACLDPELPEGLDNCLSVRIVLRILIDLGADRIMLENGLRRELVVELLLVQKIRVACKGALQACDTGHIVHIRTLALLLCIVGGHIGIGDSVFLLFLWLRLRFRLRLDLDRRRAPEGCDGRRRGLCGCRLLLLSLYLCPGCCKLLLSLAGGLLGLTPLLLKLLHLLNVLSLKLSLTLSHHQLRIKLSLRGGLLEH